MSHFPWSLYTGFPKILVRLTHLKNWLVADQNGQPCQSCRIIIPWFGEWKGQKNGGWLNDAFLIEGTRKYHGGSCVSLRHPGSPITKAIFYCSYCFIPFIITVISTWKHYQRYCTVATNRCPHNSSSWKYAHLLYWLSSYK